ncbi:hypothetical protein I3760_10G140400 [Carya illinoinensis]|nr:hypothetical protein I3760_10G140400 [Carya illinoinensis]KAG2685751.1 hypothetical protein I3760_10G140400 [Carya illinoinensis]
MQGARKSANSDGWNFDQRSGERHQGLILLTINYSSKEPDVEGVLKLFYLSHNAQLLVQSSRRRLSPRMRLRRVADVMRCV